MSTRNAHKNRIAESAQLHWNRALAEIINSVIYRWTSWCVWVGRCCILWSITLYRKICLMWVSQFGLCMPFFSSSFFFFSSSQFLNARLHSIEWSPSYWENIFPPILSSYYLSLFVFVRTYWIAKYALIHCK